MNESLSPEEIKFFETGELQPGMTPASPPEPPTPEVQAAQTQQTSPAPPAADPSTPPAVTVEAIEILRQSLEEAQRRAGHLEARLEQLNSKPPEVPDPPAPDPNTDPLGAMMHQLATVNKTVAQLQAQLVQQQQQSQQLTEFQRFQQQVHTLRNEFVKTTPDFDAAYAHVRDARVADLKMLGYTEDKIQRQLFEEEATLAQNAIKQGRNPAQVVYEMAKRHGYTAKPGTAAPTPPDNKLASIQQAQAAAKSLPSTPQLEEITLDGLKAASDSDLNKLVTDDKLWSKIVGADQYPL